MDGLWKAVDHYIYEMLLPEDPVLKEVLDACREAGLPAIQVSPSQGMLLHLLARIQGAAKILEFGTLGGYSAVWLARALPESGKLVTMEADLKHARIAAANIEKAGLSGVVELRVGPALETLPRLQEESYAPFDLFFIDADKVNIPRYLDWSLRLARPGSVIIVDNVVRGGAVVEQKGQDPGAQGVREMFEMIADDARLKATAVQTVGSRGYDGFAIALVERL